MNVPLPSNTLDVHRRVGLKERHAGLQLDKLSWASDMKDQNARLHEVVKCVGGETLIRSVLERRRQALLRLGAIEWSEESGGPLTLHLAHAAALENAGICLHPIYGFVYLPGSGLKGMARAYAETLWLKDQADKRKAWEEIEDVFGWAPNRRREDQIADPEHPAHVRISMTANGTPGTLEEHAGAVIFHDAWPTHWPSLEVDITNNHHPQYYGAPCSDTETEPGDWENPIPVYFLCVPQGVEFSFALSARSPSERAQALVGLARDWLKGALRWLGAGAKTAAGYGHFTVRETIGERPSVLKSYETEVTLVTPAFLAGAEQSAQDCVLRAASVRGLLRWWWRSLHADTVDMRQLRALEQAVWGNTETGSAVRVVVECGTAPRAEQFAKLKNGNRFEERFGKRHALSPPPRGLTPGLLYLAFGMTSGNTSRWYMSAGASWRISLTASDSEFAGAHGHYDGTAPSRVVIPAYQVLDQAKAALWLLRHFGGVGAKARKGFGSFDDDSEGSLDWCVSVAAEFRRVCGLNDAVTKAYSDARVAEVELPVSDAWWVLNELGLAVQDFAHAHKHDPTKEALGLPRKIHGPRGEPMNHQDRVNHQPPVHLGKHHRRHAAPIHYHVGLGSNSGLVVRIVSFPNRFLPDFEISSRVLSEAVESVAGYLGISCANAPQSTAASGEPTSTRSLSRTRPVRNRDSGPAGTPRPEAQESDDSHQKFQEFTNWFDAQGFSASNKKGRQHEIIQRIEQLPPASRQLAKQHVRQNLKRKEMTPAVWEYVTK